MRKRLPGPHRTSHVAPSAVSRRSGLRFRVGVSGSETNWSSTVLRISEWYLFSIASMWSRASTSKMTSNAGRRDMARIVAIRIGGGQGSCRLEQNRGILPDRQVDDHADEAVVSPGGALRAGRILVADRCAHA